MEVSVLHYDSFTTVPNMGNPAGVVLAAGGLSEEEMQSVALKVGFNETAFVLGSRQANLRIRFFTPGHEIPLCGHATIASLIALFENGMLPVGSQTQSLTIETMAGLLPIGVLAENADEAVFIDMKQAPAKFLAFDGDLQDLAESLGIQVDDIHPSLPVVFGSTGTWTLVVPIATRAAVESMTPTSERFPDVLKQMPRASIHPFSMETVRDDADLHGRHFSSPFSGTLEDPITGTASGVIGAYLAKFASDFCVERDYTFQVEQGFEVGREGRIQVVIENRHEPFEVKISGTGVYVNDMSIQLA